MTEKVLPEPATSTLTSMQTEVGSVFVSNYPPYSFWNSAQLSEAERVLNEPPTENTLGLYLHIPFCRKRCKFCYFRVYTEKNSDEVQSYLDALRKEVDLYSKLPSVAGRTLKFVYFGGGTPSFISANHLKSLSRRLKESISWKGSEEVTFECEPGTLTETKLEVIKQIGVTRLSLGVESFDDFVLEENGRAHRSKEIYRVMPWIRSLNFQQLNIDLIAGMLGETWDTWRDAVQRTIDLSPDSVTIYQMELPFNTVFSHELVRGDLRIPLANWDTKRAWHDYAFEHLVNNGYVHSSAYTMVKDKNHRFVYRDSVWHGTDMIGTGVASFSHMSGVHFQNLPDWDGYMQSLESNKLPLHRAYPISKRERLIREVILQLKLGEIRTEYFQNKFHTNVLEEFREPLEQLQSKGYLTVHNPDRIQLTRSGLLRVDQLLPLFYDPQFRNARYT
ncbi:coproporphyrinogen III oxidase family protein [bacterium]|nr:coproporphyrinogen III oxidase family protein [bacterium]MCI0603670.1 coproporphyrinogen III oxidase family protein [bacterium]